MILAGAGATIRRRWAGRGPASSQCGEFPSSFFPWHLVRARSLPRCRRKRTTGHDRRCDAPAGGDHHARPSGTERDWIVESSPNDLVIDALFGTGLSRPLDGLAAGRNSSAVNKRQLRTILAVDIPSGLDCDTGLPIGSHDAPAIRAAETVSFCGLKQGFAVAKAYTGKVTVADIGAPYELLKEPGR